MQPITLWRQALRLPLPVIPNERGALLYARLANKLVRYSAKPHDARLFFGACMSLGGRDLLQRYLILFQVWEPSLSYWLFRTLKPGDLVVDVGANIGYYSLFASKLVGPSGSVIAIEASPSIYATLLANARRNHAAHIIPMNMVVSDTSSSASVFKGPERNTGLTSTIPGPRLEEEAQVRAEPLDAILPLEKRRRVRFVKIDVEGAEMSVIRGMGALLREGPEELEILVEMSGSGTNGTEGSPESVFRQFRALGFRAYALRNDYGLEDYLPNVRIAPPVPVDQPPAGCGDVLFTRRTPDRVRELCPPVTVGEFLRDARLRFGRG